MSLDDILVKLGSFKRYQILIYLVLGIPGMVCAFHTMSNNFLQARGNFTCDLPGQSRKNASYNGQCEYIGEDGDTKPCEEFIYSKEYMQSSVAMEWHLVCSKAYFLSIADSLYGLGTLIGSILYGSLSDRIGRKKSYMIGIACMNVTGVAISFSPHVWVYIVLRMLGGINNVGVYMISFVMAMELVGPEYRNIAGIGAHLFFAIGYMALSPLARALPNWQHFQWAITASSLFLLTSWFYIPESLRWMLVHSKTEEAIALIKMIAKYNKIPFEEEEEVRSYVSGVIAEIQQSNTGKENFIRIYHYPKIAKRMLFICLAWLSSGMIYYGISFNAESYSDNLFLNHILLGLAEIPSYLIIVFFINKLGRKIILCGSLFVGGSALILTSLIDYIRGKVAHIIVLLLVTTGKTAVGVTFAMVYIYTSELTPTSVRNSCVAAGSVVARIGSALAPYINLLGNYTLTAMPLISFGALSIIAGVLGLNLPETKNASIPDTLEEAEKEGA